MVESKAAHLALLQRCQEQRDQGLSPSIAEQLHLESLLAEHDRRVQVFSAALKVLKTTDPDVMPRLLALMR